MRCSMRVPKGRRKPLHLHARLLGPAWGMAWSSLPAAQMPWKSKQELARRTGSHPGWHFSLQLGRGWRMLERKYS